MVMKQNTLKDIDAAVSKVPFRAYDIRGVVGETIDDHFIYLVALSIGSEAEDLGEKSIVIGRDGRLSSPALFKALKQGLLDSGREVIDIGIVPSPVLYFATHILQARSGVVLTASHNPASDNGLKIILSGETLANERIQALYQRIQEKRFHYGQGTFYSRDIIDQYIDRIVGDIQLKKPLKIVIDCGNGVASNVAPKLFRRLGCEVIELFCEIDGSFPNHQPDPTVIENLQSLISSVKQGKADLGLAFDGDGDRLGVVTEKGESIWTDRLLILFALDVISRQPGGTIVYDVKSTRHLKSMIIRHGGKPLMTKTGHSLVKAKMKEVGSPLAGELSGHIFFQERWYGFDDGLYVACRLLEILAKQETRASEIFQLIPDSVNTPEIKVPLPDEAKASFMNQLQQKAEFKDGEIIDIDGLRVEFADGWGLLRPSNTTPCLVLRFEADNARALERIKSVFKAQLLKVSQTLEIPF